MRGSIIGAAFAAGALLGCAAGSPTLTAQPPEPASPLGSPFADRRAGFASIAFPLLLDRSDFRIGTTVQFTRIPTLTELHDLTGVTALQHVVISLPKWPSEYAALQVLDQLPAESDVIVVLPGYPPSREALDAWNLVNARLRIVIVVTEPPPSAAVIADFNGLRSLERVIAQMDDPRRTGFERLQRPLSFRKLME
ncbi:MAG TPA: hypothetical protein VGK89_11760 [Candidatus Eisenbacteria bacterium]|jgi:hypothetical protein